MSERELDLELDLECSLCKDVYREPKTLGCLHSFCLECLEIHYERNHSNVKLKCPICRTPFQSESREHLSNLSTDSFLLNSLNIQNSLKNSIHEHNNQKSKCSDKKNEENSISNSQIYCPIHEQKELEIYCDDCKIVLCGLCVFRHLTHKLSTISDAIGYEKLPLIDLINQVSFSLSLFLFSFFFFLFLFKSKNNTKGETKRERIERRNE